MHAADGAAVAQDVHARQIAVALVGQRGDGKAQLLGGAHAVFAAKGQHRAAVGCFQVAHVGGDQAGGERRYADAVGAKIKGALGCVPAARIICLLYTSDLPQGGRS